MTEPALQRRRIVPYRHNHNIFSTSTVKQLNDGDWLEAVGNDGDDQISTAGSGKRKVNYSIMNFLAEYDIFKPNGRLLRKDITKLVH